jgi:hypothetical protein
MLGKLVRCPDCAETFTVVDASTEPPAESAVTTTPPRSKSPLPDDEEPPPPPRRRRWEEDEDDYRGDDDDEYEDRPRRRDIGRGRRRDVAASACAGPAIALMIVGGLAAFLSVLSLGLNLAGAGLAAAQGVGGGQGPPLMFRAGTGVAGALFGICWGGVIFGGAWQLYNVRSYAFAMTASIVAMVPCNLCCIFGLPFGIWALVVLCREDVKEAFR